MSPIAITTKQVFIRLQALVFERDLMGFHAGDTLAHLTGQTLDGTDVAGEDDVNLIGYWPS